RLMKDNCTVDTEITCTGTGQVSLWHLMEQQGIFVQYLCGGNGTCGKCKVKVVSGASEPTTSERNYFTNEELQEGYRLACQMKVAGDCVVEVPRQRHKMQGLSIPVNHESEAQGKDDTFGVAIDLGTTTLAFVLVNLENKQVVQDCTMENSQRIYGADVMSRMQRANEGALEQLRDCIVNDLQEGVTSLCRRFERKTGQKPRLAQAVISGNTTMCHLLQGLSCERLAVAPFIPETLEKRELVRDGVKVTILPGASAFIGGDIISGLSYLDFAHDETPKLLLDLGTNGEMVLWNGEEFLATSAAAGPALEGGNISCGCAGIYGAIYDVFIAGDKSQVKTIGGIAPVGICGSGLLAAISGLLNNGLLDEHGTFSDKVKESRFLLATTATGEGIVITGEDVRAFLMAKSAIVTGVCYLLEQMDAREQPIQVYLAGGLGVHLPVSAAVKTGLLPEQIKSNCKPGGNTSLQGAIAYLINPGEMDARMQAILGQLTVLPLNEWDGFEEKFISNMALKKV
ncbi:MAG: ASKHA domain-containing protein, partial [Lachnospiraceae bacterium]|nr:ASKHA domain-containing protein [Lachnospiraceae bacterium]